MLLLAISSVFLTAPSPLTGEKQSRIIEGTEIGDDLIEIRTKEVIENKDDIPVDPKIAISELTKQIKEVNDKMEKMLGKANEATNDELPSEKPLSLDPRSDLSDEK